MTEVVSQEDRIAMTVEPIAINWHSGLSIFASESYLRAVGDKYGWLGGIDGAGRVRCVLPYTIIRKLGVSMVRFRVETIPLEGELDLAGERAFLEGVVGYFRAGGEDMIIPGTTNTIFRTYPEGAIAAPYGTYVIDLRKSEEQLWSAVHSTNRRNIRNATKRGVTVKVGMEYLDVAYALIRDTFRRSRLPFMNRKTFQRIIAGVSDHVKILVTEYEGVIQYSVVVFYSSYSAYAVYGGSIPNPVDGSTKMLHWHAMRLFRDLGVRRYDLVGSRIDPNRGSKQENLMLYKVRLGAVLSQGYMWKYVLRPVKSAVYSVAVRLLRGGDIVDNERHKLIEQEMTTIEQSGQWAGTGSVRE